MTPQRPAPGVDRQIANILFDGSLYYDDDRSQPQVSPGHSGIDEIILLVTFLVLSPTRPMQTTIATIRETRNWREYER